MAKEPFEAIAACVWIGKTSIVWDKKTSLDGARDRRHHTIGVIMEGLR